MDCHRSTHKECAVLTYGKCQPQRQKMKKKNGAKAKSILFQESVLINDPEYQRRK